MRLDPAIIKHQIDNLLAQFPELIEDDVLRTDMIEGQTDAFTFLSMLVRKIGESDALADGVDLYRQELAERESRIRRRIFSLRGLAFKIMEAAELKKAELPEATLSIRNGTPKVIIVDETQLPENCVRTKTEPDKTKIKDALLSGETVEGAVLSNAEPSLSIRIK